MLQLEESPDRTVVEASLQTLVDQLRNMIDGLRPSALNFGLWQALDDLFNEFIDRSEHTVVEFNLPATNLHFDPDVELHLYRIVQEAVTNAVRHARASRINLSGSLRSDRVELIVADDGLGFGSRDATDLPRALAGRHFGIANMIERSQLIGAQVRIDTSPGSGTRVNILWTPPDAP